MSKTRDLSMSKTCILSMSRGSLPLPLAEGRGRGVLVHGSTTHVFCTQ